MAGIKITDLPAAPSALLTDVFPVDQLPGPVTYKESNAQLLTLFQSNMPSSITGTANEILVNGTSGVATTGAITLTTPQSLATTAAFQVNTLQFNSNNGLLDSFGNEMLSFNPSGGGPVNYLQITNAPAGQPPNLAALGTDPNVSFTFYTKGAGRFGFYSATTTAVKFFTGTTYQHETDFVFADTANTRTITWPDASGTVALTGSTVSTITGTANQVLVNGTSATPTSGAITLTTPQSLATTAAFQVNTLQFNSNNGLLDSNGKEVLSVNPFGAGAVNYISIANSGTGVDPNLQAVGTDVDIGLSLFSKGAAAISLWTQSPTVPVLIKSGTSSQHNTSFVFANTANSRAVTFPDASFTITGTASAMTNGQIPIGNTGNLPTAATLTAGTGVSITNAAGSITIGATGGGLAIATIAGTTQAAVVNTKYYALAAGQTSLTLPATYAVGDIIALVGSTANTGGWIVATATGDTIRVNNVTTSVSGTVTSAATAGQTIYLECDVANTSWVMTSTVSTTLTTS